MSLIQKINAFVLVFILFFGCNIAYSQESNLTNPEPKIGERLDFIQSSFNKGQTRAKADLRSSESNISERIDFIQKSFDKGQTPALVWSYTWMGINGVGAGVQTYQAIRSSQNRVFNIV